MSDSTDLSLSAIPPIQSHSATGNDLRLLHAAANLSDLTPQRMLGCASESVGIAASYDRLRAGTPLPNALRGELRDVVDREIRREVEIGKACVATSRAVAYVIFGMSGLALLAALLL